MERKEREGKRGEGKGRKLLEKVEEERRGAGKEGMEKGRGEQGRDLKNDWRKERDGRKEYEDRG